jgi:serine/threonine protein kinase
MQHIHAQFQEWEHGDGSSSGAGSGGSGAGSGGSGGGGCGGGGSGRSTGSGVSSEGQVPVAGSGSGGQGGHPNIQQLVEAVDDGERLHIIMPYHGGGDLLELIQSHGPLREDVARAYLQQIVGGLGHLHRCCLAHFDLSCENILLESPEPVLANTATIIDFGQCLRGVPGRGRLMFARGCGGRGKINYMAPECFSDSDDRGFDGIAADMWSVGVMMFIMLVGAAPWDLDQGGRWMPHESDDRYNLIAQQGVGALLRHWGELDRISPAAVNLMDRLMCPDGSRRLCTKAALEHAWLAQNIK